MCFLKGTGVPYTERGRGACLVFLFQEEESFSQSEQQVASPCPRRFLSNNELDCPHHSIGKQSEGTHFLRGIILTVSKKISLFQYR